MNVERENSGGIAVFTQQEEIGIELAWVQGCARFPDITIPRAIFVSHVVQRCPVADNFESWIKRADVIGLYFACACLLHNAKALRSLRKIIVRNLATHSFRYRLTHEAKAEAEQALWMKLLGTLSVGPGCLAMYSGMGSLESFLRVVVCHHILDQARAQGRRKKETINIELLGTMDSCDLEAEYIGEHYRVPFEHALSVALDQLSPEERDLCWLYFCEFQSIDGLAVHYGVHRSTVARRVQQLRRCLRCSIQHNLQATLGIAPEETRELWPLVQGRIDIELRNRLSLAPVEVSKAS